MVTYLLPAMHLLTAPRGGGEPPKVGGGRRQGGQTLHGGWRGRPPVGPLVALPGGLGLLQLGGELVVGVLGHGHNLDHIIDASASDCTYE